MTSVPDQCGAAEPGRNIGEGASWAGTVKDAAECSAKCTSLSNYRAWETEPVTWEQPLLAVRSVLVF